MKLMQAATHSQSGGGLLGPGSVVAPTITVTGVDGKTQVLQVPQSHDDMEALIARRSQIKEQLDAAVDSRNDIVEQLGTAPKVAEPGLTAQLKVVNDQIVQLETDLAATGRQISAASSDLIAMATTEQPSQPDNDGDVETQVQEGIAVGAGTMFVVMSAVILFLRRGWRRRGAGGGRQLPDDTSPRLARLEQGMDAIAIEIERISEGQRFVTKLLSDSQGASPALRGGEPTTLNARDQTR